MRKKSRLFRKFQRAADGGIAAWMDSLNGLSRVIGQNIVFYDQISRRHREPNPLSIRHVWMYMIEWTIRQIEWYRDNKILLPSQALA